MAGLGMFISQFVAQLHEEFIDFQFQLFVLILAVWADVSLQDSCPEFLV